MEDEHRPWLELMKHRLTQWISLQADIAGWKTRKLTENLVVFLVRIGHPFFLTRFQYNPQENIPLQTIKSSVYKYIHYVILSIMLFGSSAQFIAIFVDIFQNEFDLRSGTATIRLLITLTNGLAAVLLFNLSWFAEEIAQQWNMAIQMTEEFLTSQSGSSGSENPLLKEQISKRRQKMHAICQALFITFIILLIIIWITVNPLSLIRCPYHIYSPFFPICNETNGKHNGGWMEIIGYTVLQYFTSYYYCVALTFSACFIIHGVQITRYAFDVLKIQTDAAHTDGSGFNLSEELDWNKNYRSINIFIIGNYNAFGRVVYPIFFADVIIALVIGNVILLTPGSDLIAKGSTSIVSFGLILFILLAILDATKFPTQSAALLTQRKKLQILQSCELKQWFKCCRPIRIYVRNFCYLREEFIPAMLDLVIDCTIDAILA